MKNLRRKNRLKNNNQFKQIIYQIKHLILKKTIINNKRNKHRMIHFINYLFRLVFLCKINWPSLNRLNSLFCFNVECWFLFVLIFSYLLNWIQSMKWPINFFIVIHHGYLSSISKTFKVKSIHFQTFFLLSMKRSSNDESQWTSLLKRQKDYCQQRLVPLTQLLISTENALKNVSIHFSILIYWKWFLFFNFRSPNHFII